MMRERKDPGEDDLELLFAAARAETRATAPEALMARVAADAERLRPAPAPASRRRAPVRRRGPLAAFLAQIGGWPALGGLATAGVAGFWLGLAPPAAVETLGGDLIGLAPVESLTGLLPTYDLAEFVEG